MRNYVKILGEIKGKLFLNLKFFEWNLGKCE